MVLDDPAAGRRVGPIHDPAVKKIRVTGSGRAYADVKLNPETGLWENMSIIGDPMVQMLQTTWTHSPAERAGMCAQVTADLLNAGDIAPGDKKQLAAVKNAALIAETLAWGWTTMQPPPVRRARGMTPQAWGAENWALYQAALIAACGRHNQTLSAADCRTVQAADAFRPMHLMGGETGHTIPNCAAMFRSGVWLGADGRMMERAALNEGFDGRRPLQHVVSNLGGPNSTRRSPAMLGPVTWTAIHLAGLPDLDPRLEEDISGVFDNTSIDMIPIIKMWETRAGYNYDMVTRAFRRLATDGYGNLRMSDRFLSQLRPEHRAELGL